MLDQFQKSLYWAATLPLLPKIMLSVIVVAAAIFILVVLWGPVPDQSPEKSSTTSTEKTPGAPNGTPAQNAEITESPNANVYQAGGDIIITAPQPDQFQEQTSVQSILVEVRLTCTVRPDSELPPDEVNFIPVGDSHAYLEGSAGNVRLSFQSPVRFRRLDNDRLVVTNRFVLDSGSEVIARPLGVLQNYRNLLVPVITVVWGRSLQNIKLLEVSLFVNGQGPLYGSWNYDVPFQESPRFSVDFGQFTDRLFQL